MLSQLATVAKTAKRPTGGPPRYTHDGADVTEFKDDDFALTPEDERAYVPRLDEKYVDINRRFDNLHLIDPDPHGTQNLSAEHRLQVIEEELRKPHGQCRGDVEV